jgi:hypothetical protein
MKKTLISIVMTLTLFTSVTQANAHGWNGRGWNVGLNNGWAPFAAGAVLGTVVANTYRPYYRPTPVYFAQPQASYYPVTQTTAAYCPENGLYYPQTQACPSGWQQVPVNQ